MPSLPASSPLSQMGANMTTLRPPRDNLVRALRPGPALRAVEGGPPVMTGLLTPFNEWTEIDSLWEGNFLERIAPGAATKTIAENRDRVKVTFNHGQDPELGDKVLGPIELLEEHRAGVAYEVPLFPSVPPLIVDGLRAGQYGSSMRFRVMREDIVSEPELSDYNPKGIPERTVTEFQLLEFGPVTFPAYAGATSGVRSMTDELFMEMLTSGEGLKRLADFVRQHHAPSEDAEPVSPPPERRETPTVTIPRHAEWMAQRKAR